MQRYGWTDLRLPIDTPLAPVQVSEVDIESLESLTDQLVHFLLRSAGRGGSHPL